MSFEPPGYCPNCGEFVEVGEKACEECGSCSETGWSDESMYDGIDLDNGQEEGVRDNRLLGTIVSIGLLALLLYVFVLR